jgi:hypothetical protein
LDSSIRFEVPSFSGQASLPRRSCSSTVNRSGKLTLTTTDSNTWGGNSGFTYTFPRQPDGTTAVDVVVVREGKNLKGRLLGIVLGLFGKRVLGKGFNQTIKAIEARNDGATAAEPTADKEGGTT